MKALNIRTPETDIYVHDGAFRSLHSFATTTMSTASGGGFGGGGGCGGGGAGGW